MTLFKREPRSVYRVYAEGDPLGEETAPIASFDAQPPVPTGGPRPVALLAAGAIVAVALGALAIVIASAGHGSRRRPAAAEVASPRRRQLSVQRSPRRWPHRRHAAAHRRARPARLQRLRPASVPLPATHAVVAPTPLLFSALDAEREFGFER